MGMDDPYKEVTLDHYKSPRNKRPLPEATLSRHKNNPLCGDEITIHARVDHGKVIEVTFEGQGCSISQASASMLTGSVAGRDLEDARSLAGDFREMMEGKQDPDEEELGDLMALKGVVRYPVRIKCAVLPWDVFQDVLGEAGGG
jgi:nitrogen fixation protein NifU and related proteins